MKTILKTICAIALIYCWMLASNDQYNREKESEQLVAGFWLADGSKHFSGSEE